MFRYIYFTDVFVGYTVIVTIYDVWSPHTGWISGKWLQYAWYVTNVFLLGTCLFRTPFPWPLIVSRDHYALLYNIVSLFYLYGRLIGTSLVPWRHYRMTRTTCRAGRRQFVSVPATAATGRISIPWSTPLRGFF